MITTIEYSPCRYNTDSRCEHPARNKAKECVMPCYGYRMVYNALACRYCGRVFSDSRDKYVHEGEKHGNGRR